MKDYSTRLCLEELFAMENDFLLRNIIKRKRNVNKYRSLVCVYRPWNKIRNIRLLGENKTILDTADSSGLPISKTFFLSETRSLPRREFTDCIDLERRFLYLWRRRRISKRLSRNSAPIAEEFKIHLWSISAILHARFLKRNLEPAVKIDLTNENFDYSTSNFKLSFFVNIF